MNKKKVKISIIIPVYNEEKTILKIINKINKVKLYDLRGKSIEKELIIVDDFSKDKSRIIIQNLDKKIKKYYHKKNMGKGSALKTGFQKSTGNIILIQDADLEYDPFDYPKLLRPILQREYCVVYGSRFEFKIGDFKRRGFFFIVHTIGNFLLTLITNILYFSRITDLETGYKVFTKKALKKIGKIRSNSFDFEPEITAKFLKRGFKIKEVPINYYSRGYHEGKKITWIDGIMALITLIKFRFFD